MYQRAKVMLALAGVLAMGASPVLAQRGPGMGWMGRAGGMGMGPGQPAAGIELMLQQRERLGLSDEQVRALEGLRDAFRAQVEPLREEMREQAEQAREDRRTRREAWLEQREAWRERMDAIRDGHRERVDEVLTDEQRQELDRLRSSFRGRAGRPGMRRGAPGFRAAPGARGFRGGARGGVWLRRGPAWPGGPAWGGGAAWRGRFQRGFRGPDGFRGGRVPRGPGQGAWFAPEPEAVPTADSTGQSGPGA